MLASMHHHFKEHLRQSVKEACEAFPDRLSRTVLFVGGISAPIYVTPDIADQLTAKTASLRCELEHRKRNMAQRYAVGIACHPRRVAGVDDVRMIGLARRIPATYAEGYTLEMRVLYVLDHEIGHHVVRNGMTGDHEGECRADAFAALRHIQRFGLDTAFFTMSAKAAAMVLDMSPMHYTQDVLFAVRRCAARYDVSRLTLEETAHLADRIVTLMAPDKGMVYRLSYAFSRAGRVYRDAYQSKEALVNALYDKDPRAYELFCRETAKVMRASANDRPVIQAARRFLNYPPIKDFIDAQAATSKEWQEIQRLARIPLPPAAVVQHRMGRR